MRPILSFWHISYGGPQHGVMLKKLERLAAFKAIDPIVEKIHWQGRPMAQVSFFVEHPTHNWQTVQHAVLELAWQLTPTWRITRLGHDLRGEWSQDAVGPNEPFEPLVSSCLRIDWWLDKSQTYSRPNYLQGQANHW